jgi:acetyltransferase
VSAALQPVEHVPRHVFETASGNYVVRIARLSDEAKLRGMLERAAPEDVRLRFFRHIRTFPAALIEPLLRSDEHRYFAFVAHPVEDRRTLVASAMLVADPDGQGAEFGIFVDRAHRGRHLGNHLLDCLFSEARAHGISRIHGLILAGNAAMIELARFHGFTVVPDGDEPDCVRAESPVAATTAGSP